MLVIIKFNHSIKFEIKSFWNLIRLKVSWSNQNFSLCRWSEHNSKWMEISSHFEVDCSIPRLKDSVLLFTAALQICQQLKDKASNNLRLVPLDKLIRSFLHSIIHSFFSFIQSSFDLCNHSIILFIHSFIHFLLFILIFFLFIFKLKIFMKKFSKCGTGYTESIFSEKKKSRFVVNLRQFV